MFVLGDPTEAQLAAYRLNMELKAATCESLKPGRRCDDIFREITARADRSRVALRGELGIGHGVGVSEREGPYLQAGDSTALESGMVVAVEVNTDGPRGEVIRSKDIYEIRSDGPRLLSWYRNWDRLYHVFGYRSAH
jgi:Xaa-Pro aminopeptidase